MDNIGLKSEKEKMKENEEGKRDWYQDFMQSF